MARKRKTDPALPKSIAQLQVRWREVKVLSVMNVLEHLLDQGFPRDLINRVVESNPQPLLVQNNNNNPLHILAEAAL